MKLVVGLGNPGKEYENTRHNIGFMALDHFLKNESFKQKENYEYCERIIDGEKVLFLKPLTYMNNSGDAIRDIIKYYKAYIDDLTVFSPIQSPLSRMRRLALEKPSNYLSISQTSKTMIIYS